MTIQTAAGASLAVSASSIAAFTASGYGAATYTTVGEITNIGEFGKQYELVTFNPLATRGTKKLKGSWDAGSLTPELGLDPDDAGQAIMETALDSDAAIACRVTLQDGTVYYFMGLVMAFRPNVGSVNDVVMATCQIEVTDDATAEVAA